MSLTAKFVLCSPPKGSPGVENGLKDPVEHVPLDSPRDTSTETAFVKPLESPLSPVMQLAAAEPLRVAKAAICLIPETSPDLTATSSDEYVL